MTKSPEKRLGIVAEAAEALLTGRDAAELASSILGLSRRLLAADAYAVWRLFPDEAEWRVVADHNLSAQYSRTAPAPDEKDLPDRPIFAPDVRKHPLMEARRGAHASEGVRSLLSLPLRIRGVNSGSIVFYFRRPHRLDPTEMTVASALGSLAAAALTNAELHAEQERTRRLAERSQEALRESEQRFARFMQHLPGLAWIKDSDGRYVYANDTARRAFGVPREELYGKTDHEIFPPATADQFIENDRRALDAGAGVQVIETLEQPDGVVHHSLVSKFPIPGPDGQRPMVGGMAVDITTRIEAEDALQLQAEALRTADRRKDEFLAMLAHELRNPLAPITNAVHILNSPAATAESQRHQRAIIERQARLMARMLDDLLDVSRITRGKIELRQQPVDLANAVGLAVEGCLTFVEERSQRLSVSLPAEPIWVHADPTRVHQVVGNLLNNAARYTEVGGEISVALARDGDDAVIHVRDTGIGIATELLPRIFELFTQGERSLARTDAGLGIGLTMVKQLVEMHHGSVEARSAGPGRGSEFVVRLTALASAPDRAVRPGAEDESANDGLDALSVLIVEDNRDAAESLGEVLELWGCVVRIANNGPSALEAVDDSAPDIVLLDIGIPGLDGYEVARRIRRRRDLRSILLVALTGYGMDEDRRRGRQAGFDHYLTKPLEPEELLKLLRTVDRPAPGC